MFQWPLIGHHICDDLEGMEVTLQVAEFQWPLIGHHICDLAQQTGGMIFEDCFNGL